MDTSEILRLVKDRPWILLAAIVIGLVVRLSKSDIPSLPTIAPKSRVWIAVILGVLSGVLEKKFSAGGASLSWTYALLGGFGSTALAIVGHQTVIESLRGGKEIAIPWLTKSLAKSEKKENGKEESKEDAPKS